MSAAMEATPARASLSDWVTPAIMLVCFAIEVFVILAGHARNEAVDREWIDDMGIGLYADLQRAVPSDDVPHGSLLVAAELEPDFERAAWYLRHDSAMRAVLSNIERAPFITELTPTLCWQEDGFWRELRRVAWSPIVAMRTTLGGTQSPALALGHELAHAEASGDEGDALTMRSDDQYDTSEERRVITGPEIHAAITLGEGVRYDHRGQSFVVDSVTSRLPDEGLRRLLDTSCVLRGEL